MCRNLSAGRAGDFSDDLALGGDVEVDFEKDQQTYLEVRLQELRNSKFK